MSLTSSVSHSGQTFKTLWNRWKPGWKTAVIASVLIYAFVSMQIFSNAGASLEDLRFRIDMTPFLESKLPLQIHVVSAVTTFMIGALLLSGLPKGTSTHRRLGWLWVITMLSTAISSFFMTGLSGHSYSVIHGLSAWTVIILPFAVVAARRHNVKKHSKEMRSMFLGGMVIAGLFSFLPGRMMWQMFFTV